MIILLHLNPESAS